MELFISFSNVEEINSYDNIFSMSFLTVVSLTCWPRGAAGGRLGGRFTSASKSANRLFMRAAIETDAVNDAFMDRDFLCF